MSLFWRASVARLVLRRTESSAPAERIVRICRIFAVSSAAALTTWACSPARRDRSWHVADISCVDALISWVDAEIWAAIAAASSAAVRIAPTSRRSAYTIEWTADSRSPTSLDPPRWVTTVTERSPPATRLATAPAARTGSVMRSLSQAARRHTSSTATTSRAAAPSQIVRSVAWATAYARLVGWRNSTHHFPRFAGTETTSSEPRGVLTIVVEGRSWRGIA